MLPGIGFWAPASGALVPAVLQSTSTLRLDGASSGTLTLSGVQAGSTLVVASSAYEFGADGLPDSVSSSPALTWTQAVQSPNANTFGDGNRAAIWTARATASGGHTVTLTYNSGYAAASMAEVSNLASASLVNATASASGTSSSPVSGTAAGTVAAGIAFACLTCDSSNPSTGIKTPSGWTNAGRHDTASTAQPHSLDYLVVSATGNLSAAWGPLNQSERWAGAIAILRAQGA